ncbi:RHS repeat-associated protein [Pedobacter sp. AK013]|uniref:DUF6443 domain-containing protein n=1 Tax=Pedobacter sp. AK013 TaxID=2723071 RepID=UPI001622D6FF|nr:DUF6443 domain-containing protein [Pedobacter sp. AK013]MBB6236402.1 RHS repeat-associated protein [Pedobacter sp. AK013]
MKKILYTVLFAVSYIQSAFAQTPSSNQNYVVESTVRAAGHKTVSSLVGYPVDSINRKIQYFDGLGRPLQTVQVQGSPGFKDIVQPVAYDAFGREAIKYQPYAAQSGTTGNYRTAALADQLSFYNSPTAGIKATGYPFAETVFEASPLNRVLQQGAPGADWQISAGHALKTEYGTNTQDEVKLWIVNNAGNGADAGVYQAGKLYKTILKDENWKSADLKAGTTEEFKDFEGRVVLKRVWETDSKSLSTYYVYDDLGNLRYVLPPAVNENGQATLNSFDESQTVFDQFIYGYRYDGRKRLVEKKIPGKGWEFMVYNKLDQVTHTQDANQRAASQWSWIKYDAFGRVVLTGVENGQGISRIDMQNYNDGVTAQWEDRSTAYPEGYTRNTHPSAGEDNTNIIFHTINYYDNYDFPDSFGQPGTGQAPAARTKSLLTGTKVKNLGTGAMLLTVNYYDLEGRIIQSKSSNHLNGTDVVDNTWNFDGSLKASTRTHTVGGTVTTIANRYEYDHVGRKIATFENINNQGDVALSHLEYNEIGQLTKKNLHNDSQATTFAYNERGWMKNSTSDQFSMELKYNDGTLAQFNGNISGQSYTNGTANAFSYSYDRLNRLTNAAAGNNLGEAISYDVMGNITSLTRDNFGTNNYTGYNGNRLTAISGFTNSSYDYDGNGNLTSDSQKNITLGYNFLNLPQTISGSQNLTYTYNAAGEKLQKQVGGTVTNYIDGIQYSNNSIDFIQTEEGLARNNNGSYSYEYNLADHLGNIRVTFYKNPNTNQLEVLQRDDYYAFGLRKVATGGTNKYLYNGKELQEELGQYDYGARFYDPVIGRWNVVDPLVEKFTSFSPYNYVLNNPLKYVDPDGRDVELGIKKHRNGNVTEVQIKSKMNLTIVGKISENRLAALKERYAKSFSGEFVTSVDSKGKLETYKTKVSSELSITVVDKIDKAKSTDHIMVMTENIAGRKESVQGVGDLGGTSSAVENGTLSTSGRFEKVASHEIGHNLGLEHKDASTSLMNEFVSGTYVTPNELKQIYGGAATSVPNNGKLIMYNDKDTRKDAKKLIKTNRVQ